MECTETSSDQPASLRSVFDDMPVSLTPRTRTSLRLLDESSLNESTLMKRWLVCGLLVIAGSFVVGILAERCILINIHAS